MNIALEKLYNQFESQQAIADRFGVKQPAISQWFSRDSVPQDRVIDVSEVTGIPVEDIIKANSKRTSRRHN